MTAPLRREALITAPNPDTRHDYVVELAGSAGPDTRIRVRYVPDRHVLVPESVPAWLDALSGGLEAVALAALDDLANELVPRWVEVTAERDAPLAHRVTVEDRQPGWDNPDLFARLAQCSLSRR